MLLRFFAFLFFLALAGQAHAAEHAIAMFGEPKYGQGFTHFDYVNPRAPKGGEVKLAAIGTFDNLNPHILKGVSAAGLGYLYDTLLASSNDESFTKYGLLAETIEVTPSRDAVTFALRKEARWHDGEPITAHDVVFSFETIMAKGHPFYKAYYADIKDAEALSEHKVRFNFKTNENRELPLIIGDLPILPKHYYEKHEFEKTTLTPPLGSGAYKIEAVEPGKWIRYRRVDDYWGKDLPVNKGRFNFDVIQYDYYRDATVAIEAFKSGEYDFREENISKQWANAYNFPAKDAGVVKQEMIKHQIPSGMQGFVFNTRREIFTDPRVREALNYVMDFEWENEKLFYGVYFRSRSFFQNSIYASRGLPSEAELALLEPFRNQLDPRVFTEEYNPPKTDGSGNNRALLLKAKALLEEAGWFVDPEGKKLTYYGSREAFEKGEAKAAPMKIEFLIASPSFERVIAPMLGNLKKLGIEGRIRTVDSAQYIKRREEFDYDIVVNVFAQSNSPGNEQMDYWHSSKAEVQGGRNLAGIKSGAVDAMVKKIVKAQTKEELVTATKALDRVLQWGFYVIPNWYLGRFRLIYWDKFSRPNVQPPYALGFDAWWIDRRKERKVLEYRNK